MPNTSVVYRASLGQGLLNGTETFALGRRREALRVNAFPLPGAARDGAPPAVCAVFETAGAALGGDR